MANNYNRRVLVKGCHIHDTGASGVCFVGDPGAVRDPLFEYGQKNDLAKIDRTPGPKTNNYPADSIVEDCLIHGIGRVERQPAGVQIEMAQHITVRDCSIYDCARAGINIGDGVWGGHLIERCDVFDTVQETHDHGSFNSWGRDPHHTNKQENPGQLNPFYCAMVEMLDYDVGQVFDSLDETDDPRWPGHKLSENTYIIFTSDNGGMEGGPEERYTDNNPLDRGKISAKEGGTRVPLLIVGPGIEKGVQSDVMVNGLDLYPTILALTGSPLPDGKHLDGCDLSPLLLNDSTDPALVKQADGTVRDTMMWHFPHGVALESTIRIGDYKLIRNYDHVMNPGTPELELFRLYETNGNKQRRVDIEETKNLASEMPDKTASMNRGLTSMLTEMNASYPSYNPDYAGELPGKDKVCTLLSHGKKGNTVEFAYQENGAKVVQADLIYTLNGGERYEEWFGQRSRSEDSTICSVTMIQRKAVR